MHAELELEDVYIQSGLHTACALMASWCALLVSTIQLAVNSCVRNIAYIGYGLQ